MKKLQRCGVFMLCGVLALSFVACSPEGGSGVTSDSTPIEQVDDSDRSGWVPFAKKTFEEGTELRIKYFKGGYGDEWLKAMEEKFEKDYPGVDVILIPSSNETDFTQTISTTLNTSPDDIYICHNIPYERLSVKNLVMNLDSLYNSVIYTDTKNTETTDDDTPVRFVDRIAASSLNMVRFNGHYVAIPEIQGAGGIAYNKTLFDANGWEIPETYEELVALAKTISEGNFKNADGEKVYPFVWSGTTAYMWDSFVYDMWVQIAGIDEFNTFMKYESKDLFDSSKYPALKQAWTYWYDLVCVNQEYSHPQSLGLDHLQANTAFAAGQAAMMPASCWTANEIGADLLEAFGTDVGLIPTPFVKEAKKDEDGNPIRVAYDMAGKDCMIIAQKGKNKQVAVEFFKWMALEENARLFPENTNGLHLAIKYDFEYLKEHETTTWAKDTVNLLSSSTRFNLYSSSPLVYNAGTPLSPYPEGNMYLEAFEEYGDPENAKTPDGVFASRWEKINAEWDTMCAAVGITP